MYRLSCIVFLDHSMLTLCIISSSNMISKVLIKVNLQIYHKRWYLYKRDTSLRQTLDHSPKVSVLRFDCRSITTLLIVELPNYWHENVNRFLKIITQCLIDITSACSGPKEKVRKGENQQERCHTINNFIRCLMLHQGHVLGKYCNI